MVKYDIRLWRGIWKSVNSGLAKFSSCRRITYPLEDFAMPQVDQLLDSFYFVEED
jgi:hypothetical protein